MENIELYIIIALIVFIVWFMFNTKKYYRGEKRKVKNLHKFAKEGETEAQHHLAKHYQKGNLVPKDCEKAAFWYQKASFSGDTEAKSYLKKFLENRKNKKNKKC